MDLSAMATRIASLPPWDNLGDQTRFSNGAVSVIGRRARSRASGYEKEFTVLQYPDWVHVAAVTPDKELVLVRQWRHGVQNFVLELPGGAIDAGEAADQAGPRELSEETGYGSDKWEPLGSTFANPAVNTNSVQMMAALDAQPSVQLPPDAGEEIEVVLVPLAEAVQMCLDGRISHPFTHATLFKLIATHPELM